MTQVTISAKGVISVLDSPVTNVAANLGAIEPVVNNPVILSNGSQQKLITADISKKILNSDQYYLKPVYPNSVDILNVDIEDTINIYRDINTGLFRNLYEDQSVLDSSYFGISTLANSSFDAADVYSLTVDKSVIDSTTSSDFIASILSNKVFTISAQPLDNLLFSIATSTDDSLISSDLSVLGLGKDLVSNLSIQDLTSIGLGLATPDQISLVDTSNFTLLSNYSDSTIAADITTFLINQSYISAFSLADSVAVGFGLNNSEVLSTVDGLSLLSLKEVTSTAAITDSLSVVSGFNRILSISSVTSDSGILFMSTYFSEDYNLEQYVGESRIF